MFQVLRDVAKAIDKVKHNGLKYTLLRDWDIQPFLKKNLCSFLDNRKAKMNTGKKYSKEITLSGVPQFSVLSPTLYTVFTNDLPPSGYGCTDTM